MALCQYFSLNRDWLSTKCSRSATMHLHLDAILLREATSSHSCGCSSVPFKPLILHLDAVLLREATSSHSYGCSFIPFNSAALCFFIRTSRYTLFTSPSREWCDSSPYVPSSHIPYMPPPILLQGGYHPLYFSLQGVVR